MNCPLCGSGRISTKFTRQEFFFFRCGICGLIFIHPVPPAKVLESIYTKDYYRPWGKDAGEDVLVRKIKSLTFNRWLDILEKLQRPAKVLDVGCAFGLFLESAAARGWDTYGLELAGYSAVKASAKFPGRIFKGDIFSAKYPDRSFDVVTMFDVIEHVPSLPGFMEEVRRILKSGGYAVFSTVNTSSFSARLMGKLWPHYKLEHIYYLNPRNFSKLLSDHGFFAVLRRNASKFMSFSYVDSYLKTYPVPFVSGFCGVFRGIVPGFIQDRVFTAATGEMFVIARKL